MTAVFYHHSDHFDGRPFRRQPGFYFNTETRSDYGITLKWDGGQFEQYHDSVFSVDLKSRVSDKFHNYGLGVQFGRQKGEDLVFLTPSLTWRFGERFTVGAATAFLLHFEDRQQNVLSLNYDFTKAISLGGRLVLEDDRTSGFIALRRSGYAGKDYYILFGNPDPEKKFAPQLIVKVVVPLQAGWAMGTTTRKYMECWPPGLAHRFTSRDSPPITARFETGRIGPGSRPSNAP